jgi:hypothetical protein
MVLIKRQFVEWTVMTITVFLVFFALSLIWPVLIALFLGVLLLLQYCCAGPQIVVLSWAGVNHLPIIFDPLRCPSLAVIFL